MTLSPVHGAVLGAAALVASPALWLSLVTGNLPFQDAVIRFLIAVPVCWLALNVVGAWFLPPRGADISSKGELADPDTRDPLARTSAGADAS